MLDVLRFWLDRRVDGFRVDVAHMIMKDPDLRDNPPNPNPKPNPYDRQHPNFHSQLHVHDRQHPDLHGVYREMRSLLDSYGENKVMIGEIDVSPWETWTL
jgi:alpha-glucosidase